MRKCLDDPVCFEPAAVLKLIETFNTAREEELKNKYPFALAMNAVLKVANTRESYTLNHIHQLFFN